MLPGPACSVKRRAQARATSQAPVRFDIAQLARTQGIAQPAARIEAEIDPTVLRDRGLDRRLDLGGAGDVGAQGEATGTASSDLGRHVLESAFRRRRGVVRIVREPFDTHHPHPFVRQAQGCGAPQTGRARRSEDDGHLADESAHSGSDTGLRARAQPVAALPSRAPVLRDGTLG
jgi:hypothetical protein